ncbi:MAG: branched-chain amino acid aminotransferase, partial [Planctomycetaceae bacterium]|nr:branched-chain amino acid aminotransferase [Planctomycetaceae bacterium]
GYVAQDLQLYDVIQADEAWLPSTPYCIAPCTRVNTLPIGDGQPGPRWRRMMDVWSNHVGMDILAQLLA